MNENKNKKPTNAQLQKRIERAIIHVDATKDTQSIFFSDKGLRLTVNEDVAIIGTGYHDHIFQNHTSEGISRPYLYTKRFLEIALENNCLITMADGQKFYSYQRLMQILKTKYENGVVDEYLIAFYVDEWLLNIFNGLYSIGESQAETFLVFVDYMHNIAKNAIVLDEHKEGLTNKQFIDELCAKMKEFVSEMGETMIFAPKSDEELLQENIEAIQNIENEQILTEQLKNEKSDE